MLALATLGLAVLCARILDWQRPRAVVRHGYRQAFIIVSRAPGAVPLLLVSTVRSCVQHACLTYLAAYFTERFDGTTAMASWVRFLGVGTFLLANLIAVAW